MRLGADSRRDEAWWRYGRHLRSRRYLRGPVVVAGIIAGAVTAAIANLAAAEAILLGLVSGPAASALVAITHVAIFGARAWNGVATCQKCNTRRTSLRIWEFGRTEFILGRAGGFGVRLPCASCQKWTLKLGEPEAVPLLQRGLARMHFLGASRKRIDEAMTLIERAGSAYTFLWETAKRRERLRYLAPIELLALEIAINERGEAEIAAERLEANRATWKEEEELASIIDDELTPISPPSRKRGDSSV